MMVFLSRDFTFDAAHRIVDYSGKCENLHGHTYKLTVTIKGEVSSNGMVLDFTILKKIVNENIIDKLDHKYLNDIFENSTTENIATWIFNTLRERFLTYNCKIEEVVLYEGANNRVIVR